MKFSHTMEQTDASTVLRRVTIHIPTNLSGEQEQLMIFCDL